MKRSVVPSRELLRFLRTQSQGATQTCPTACVSRLHTRASSPVDSPKLQRQFGTSARKPSRLATSHTEDIWSSNRNGHHALPAPRAHPPPPPHARSASTETKQRGFFGRLIHRRERERDKRKAQEAGQTYEDASAQLFNLSRTLARGSTGADLKLRCTEFDANGSVTLVSGEFKKTELIQKYGLLPRDMRKIDSSILPHILVRPTAILINLLHLRVLIQHDRVLVFDAYGSTDSYTQSLFMYDLEGKLRQKPDPRNKSTHLPYELRALEAVLISVTSGLEAEFALVRDPVNRILSELEEDIDRDKLRHLLIHSKKLGTFEQKARLVRDAIDDLLEADDDLSAMYLTERKTGLTREETDHQEVEMLLESYHKICDEIVEISGNLISNIRNTEEVIRAILDANRNQLMLLEIKFSVGTLGLAAGTLIAGLYGMNLNNFIEETNFGFGSVSAVCFVLSAIVCVYGMRKLRKVQKVRMWGEGVDEIHRRPVGGRGNWRNEAMESHAQARLGWLRSSVASPSSSSYSSSAGAHGASGPVLWPGMEGLGMHKLNNELGANTDGGDAHHPTDPFNTRGDIDNDRRSEDLDTNSDADMADHSPQYTRSTSTSASTTPPIATARDNVKSPEQRLAEEKTKEKSLQPVKKGGNSQQHHHHHQHHHNNKK